MFPENALVWLNNMDLREEFFRVLKDNGIRPYGRLQNFDIRYCVRIVDGYYVLTDKKSDYEMLRHRDYECVPDEWWMLTMEEFLAKVDYDTSDIKSASDSDILDLIAIV